MYFICAKSYKIVWIHSCVTTTSKNVKWCHLIWPTLYSMHSVFAVNASSRTVSSLPWPRMVNLLQTTWTTLPRPRSREDGCGCQINMTPQSACCAGVSLESLERWPKTDWRSSDGVLWDPTPERDGAHCNPCSWCGTANGSWIFGNWHL